MNSNINWPALESDPEIFTNYAQKLGISESSGFNEIFSLEEKEMLDMCNGQAVILCFTYNKNGPQRQTNPDQFIDPSKIGFYMKQSGKLDLACGVIAILHSLGNVECKLEEGSVLKKFFEKTKSMTPEERSAYLETCEEFKKAHSQFAGQGQSNQVENADDCNYHFIAFVNHNGKLYELDGLKEGPYLLKDNLEGSNIVPHVAEEVKKLLQNGVINENMCLMYLGEKSD
jgi:ubiquitin carboxyl-terminal hydrolase L3